MQPSYFSRAGVVALLQQAKLAPHKQRSQNFLFDRNTIQQCLRDSGIKLDDAPTYVVEIGPGLGHATTELLEMGASVTAIEIDRGFLSLLERINIDGNRPRIVHADARDIDFDSLYPDQPYTVIGNLPYGVASPLLFHTLSHGPRLQRTGIMVQREFADRMAAPSGTRDYGRLSVMVQLQWKIASRRAVAPRVFYPKPKVDSAFLVLERAANPLDCPHEVVESLVRTAFGMRRKTLIHPLRRWADEHNLDRAILDATLRQTGVDPTARAEQLPPDTYARMANALAAVLD